MEDLTIARACLTPLQLDSRHFLWKPPVIVAEENSETHIEQHTLEQS